MLRERSEIISFSRDDLERIIRHIAVQQLVSSMHIIAKFSEQAIEWRPDGGIDVVTKYQQGGVDDLSDPPKQITKRRR